MKLFIAISFLSGLAYGVPSPTVLGEANHKRGIDVYAKATELSSSSLSDGTDIHRLLRKRNTCKDDFVCPPHSERKRGRSCYDTFDDCECNPGFVKSGNRCIALRRGLCTEEYSDMVTQSASKVDFWVDMVYQARNEDERYGYYQMMDAALTEAWDEYNLVKASCEDEFGVDFLDDESSLSSSSSDGSGRLLRERQLFFKKVRNAFKKAGQAIASAAKAVVKAVVSTVETVVDVVVELVECGVGIVTDGAKCGLIGCAFGLVGVALDIAFTLATGGLNKIATVACALENTIQEDRDEGKEKKASILGPVLEGVGDAVCTINDKLNDRVLKKVCDAKKQVERGFGIEEIIRGNEVVFRFLESFRVAMCGEPGSAVLDLLEEVVSCSIGCAKENNVFCPKIDEKEDEKAPAPTPPTPPAPEIVEYESFRGKGCRTGNGGKGRDGVEFDLVFDLSESECEALCTEAGNGCKGWEYGFGSGRCERWNVLPEKFASVPSLDCHVKLD